MVCIKSGMVPVKQVNVAKLDVYDHGHPQLACHVEWCVQKLSETSQVLNNIINPFYVRINPKFQANFFLNGKNF